MIMLNNFLKDSINIGCSSFNWDTRDGHHIWGRNFDFNRLALGSNIQFIPRNTLYYSHGILNENNITDDSECYSKYAIVGMGGSADNTITVLYDGINEQGLMGGMLYYDPDAVYEDQIKKGTLGVQPTYLVTHILSQCKDVTDVEKALKDEITLLNEKIFNQLFKLHWIFADKFGESIIIEQDKNGLHIFRHTMGVLTNAPNYRWHERNLLNYANISNQNKQNMVLNDHSFNLLNGNGMQGIPGDWSSASRFIRLSFLKNYGIKGDNEFDGVNNMFRLLNNVAYPKGLIKKAEGDLGKIISLDRDVTPYEYTVYTSAACSESLRYYWTTYQNSKVHYVDLNKIKNNSDNQTFDMHRKVEFECDNL